MVGKFLNGWKRRRVPYFDHWALLKIALSKYTRPWLNVDGETRRFSGYSTDLLARYSVDFLERFDQEGDDAPWFLYVAPSAPHYPWTPAPRHARAPVPGWGGNPAVLEKDRSDKPAYVRQQHYALAEAQRVRRPAPGAHVRRRDGGPHLSQARRAGREAGDAGDLHLGQRLPLGRPRDRRRGLDGRAEARALQRVRPGAVLPALARPSRRGRHRSAAGRERRHRADRALGGRHRPDPAKPPLDGRSLLDSGRRGRMLLEYWKEPGRPIPTWASLRTRRFQYVEYYRDGRRVFREYYNLLRDPWQLRNLLADGVPSNDPRIGDLQAKLRQDRTCFGRQGSASPCP